MIARAGAEPRCWVFDVDGCLVDSLTGTSLRPGARVLLEHLAEHGDTLLLWSAGGEQYAQQRAEQFEIATLVTGYFSKEGRDGSGRYRTTHLALTQDIVVFVDDRPEDLSAELEVIAVPPYLCHDPHDRGLDAVVSRAGMV